MVDYVEEFGNSINSISSLINKYKNYDNIDLKLKIGIFESGKFSPGLHSIEFFNKIKILLDSNHFWDKTTTEKTTDIIFNDLTKRGQNKFKTEILNDTDFSYQNTPFDFRFSAHRYTQSTKKIPDNNMTREKLEYSYTISDYKFNLSKIIETQEDSNEEFYEFEIELLNLKNDTTDIYRSHSALLKIRDIINHCENISGSKVEQINNVEGFSNMTI
jgi:hypothetical protein